MDPEEGELAEYSKEFTAPPKKTGKMMTVSTEDSAGNSAEFQALKQSDKQNLTDRRLREMRLGAHRQIADGYARTLGSARPAFQMQLSQNPSLPKKQRERYAAVGVHRYSGKVALYVSDSADFAVNAQTPEPKEAYMTPAGVASSNGKRDKRVQLKLFPGSQITIPLSTAAGKVTLQMVRPYFTRDYQKGGSYDCGRFAESVGTTFSSERQDSEHLELAVRRLDVWQMMKKAGIIGWPSWLIGQPGPMKKLKTMQGF